jgi:hypothetical protein
MNATDSNTTRLAGTLTAAFGVPAGAGLTDASRHLPDALQISWLTLRYVCCLHVQSRRLISPECKSRTCVLKFSTCLSSCKAPSTTTQCSSSSPPKNLRLVAMLKLNAQRPTCATHRFCGLVVRVPGYRSRGPGSTSGSTRFSEKYWVCNGVHSASWVQLRSYLEENTAAPV